MRVVLACVVCACVSRAVWKGRQDTSIAMFVQVSNDSVALFPRLINAIWHPQNVYAVHFDAKIDVKERKRLERDMYANPIMRRNVNVLPARFVSYAGVSMLLNTIDAIAALLEMSSSWTHFINLSGSDYPLLSASNIRAVLAMRQLSRLSFVQTQRSTRSLQWFFNRRMGQIHIDPALWQSASSTPSSTVVALNVTHPFADYGSQPFVKTEGWVILQRAFCEHVVNSAEARRLLLALATSRAPDEHFFGTLLSISVPFAKNVARDAFRFVAWGDGESMWARPAYLDGALANTTGIVAQMLKSGALFARKFHASSSSVLDVIDRELLGTHDGMGGRTLYNLECVRNRARCIAWYRNKENGYEKCRS